MIDIDLTKISKPEQEKITGIVKKRIQPECPGCGRPMELHMSDKTHPGVYSSNYICNFCQNWMTQTSESRSAYVSAENAYRKAITVTIDMRRILNLRKTA